MANSQSDTYHTPHHIIKALVPFRERTDPGRWRDVDELVYKEQPAGTIFKSVTRRILFDANAGQDNQVRYFEVGPGGWSTFEHHQHTHQVIIYRGSGTAVIGHQIKVVHEGDLIFVDTNQWHQFIATDGQPLGFICIVKAQRDHPVLPTADDVKNLYRENPELKSVIHV